MATLMDNVRELFYTGEDWVVFREKMIDSITNRQPKTRTINLVDGRVVQFAYVPLPDGANMVSYIDITDTTQVEMALRERNEALEASDRLKSKFIANVSYELRSPLNSVIGFAEILLNEYFGPLNEKQKEYSSGILDSSKQLLNLINGILDLASIEAGQMTLKHDVIHVPHLLTRTVGMLEKFANEHGHAVSLEYEEHLHNIVGDERHLQHVFYNLLNNAIKFTPEQGSIIVRAFQEKDGIVIQVSDNGFGIDAKDQERVFEKFERVPTAAQAGAGLGLALVKNFIELHNGSVQITSTPGLGTTVTCRLPFNTGILLPT